MRSSEVAPKKEEPHSIRQRAPSLKMVESIQNEDIFRRNRRKQAIKLLEVSREDALNSSKMSERLTAVKRREYIIERRTQNKSRKVKVRETGYLSDISLYTVCLFVIVQLTKYMYSSVLLRGVEIFSFNSVKCLVKPKLILRLTSEMD